MVFIECADGTIVNADDIIAIIPGKKRLKIIVRTGEADNSSLTVCYDRCCDHDQKVVIKCLLTFIMGAHDEGGSSFIEHSTVMAAVRGVENGCKS